MLLLAEAASPVIPQVLKPMVNAYTKNLPSISPLILTLLLILLPGSISAASDPSFGESLIRILLLQDYNTRVVVIGTIILGVACGVLGSFLMLRKRALLSDVISHATLPGLVLAFLLMAFAGGSGKSLIGLLIGASITGIIGMKFVLLIRRYTRLKDDAALAIVLGGTFAIGIALLAVATRQPMGHAAGLEGFIYGKTASMRYIDSVLIACASIASLAVVVLLFKEFLLLSFDQQFASTEGWPVFSLDLILMTLIVIVTVVGLQAVGLILVVALLVIPPAAARFWTHKLKMLVFLAGLLGAASCWLGCALSALLPNLPAGAVIVLSSASFFTISLLFGSERGVMKKIYLHQQLKRRVGQQHLLRAIFELAENEGKEDHMKSFVFNKDLLYQMRTWKAKDLNRYIREAVKKGLLSKSKETWNYNLTEAGVENAVRMVRNHRLWEMYLITHADIAPTHVDRDADQIEHLLHPDLIDQLETMLDDSDEEKRVPSSPHELHVEKGSGI